MASLYFLTLSWQRHISQLNYEKALIGDQRIKVFREKCKRNIGIKHCVQPP